MRMIALLGTLTLSAACATNGPGPTDPCAPWRAIYVGKGDILTSGTARALLSHNRTGRDLCRWGADQ